MARIRTVKPEFFRHEALYEAERETALPLRVAFAGLWTAADREGRFVWKPRQLKLDCLPYDEVDFSRVLDALSTRGFIVKYVVDGREYGCVPSWNDHQVINNREKPSSIPEPNDTNVLTREPRVNYASGAALGNSQGEGKGREGERIAAAAEDAQALEASEPPAKPLVPPERKAAIDLGLAFLNAVGFKDYSEPPPSYYGVAELAARWIEAGYSTEMIVGETKIIFARHGGAPRTPRFFDSVFAEAHARNLRPLPTVHVRPPAESIVNAVRPSNPTSTSNRSVGDALTALTRRLEQDDGEAGHSGGDRLVQMLAER